LVDEVVEGVLQFKGFGDKDAGGLNAAGVLISQRVEVGGGLVSIVRTCYALEQTRWFPYQVLRRATAGNLVVETATRMTYDQRGLAVSHRRDQQWHRAADFGIEVPLTSPQRMLRCNAVDY
jgi:hypothetical protein